jgi:hypothetical protein
MIAAAAKRSALASFPLSAAPAVESQREAEASWLPLDNDVERGYERPLIEDVTMTNTIPGLEATMLDMAALTQAAA